MGVFARSFRTTIFYKETTMSKIEELIQGHKRVWFYLKDEQTKVRFVQDATALGCIYLNSEHLNIRNWSFKTLSDTADIPYETVKKLLNGKIRKPSFYCIWQIAQALECTVDELAGNTRPDPLTLHINENSEEISRILTDLEAILKLN